MFHDALSASFRNCVSYRLKIFLFFYEETFFFLLVKYSKKIKKYLIVFSLVFKIA